ncbi:MAG: DUF1566 domain-containing protein [Desulfobacterales bacterium]|nr:DUF1566 domain-containing protein [Desulfobacterales bacterium]
MNDIPRQKLQYIITQYGRAICDEPKRCEALLRDLCPEYKREINLLIIALKEKVAADLMTASDTMPKEVQLARFTKRLYDNLGIAEEFAQWTVDSWALALGVISVGRSGYQAQKAEIRIPREKKSDKRTQYHAEKVPYAVKYRLRSKPLTVSSEEAEKIFKLTGDFRPQKYVKNDYNDNGDGTITDHATGLMWQKSGSGNYMRHKKTQVYIQKLNSERFAGYSDWRLPTTEELISLLEEERQSNGLYVDPVFKSQLWCWSSDKHSFGGDWGVDLCSGDVYRGSVEGDGYVRVVRSRTS